MRIPVDTKGSTGSKIDTKMDSKIDSKVDSKIDSKGLLISDLKNTSPYELQFNDFLNHFTHISKFDRSFRYYFADLETANKFCEWLNSQKKISTKQHKPKISSVTDEVSVTLTRKDFKRIFGHDVYDMMDDYVGNPSVTFMVHRDVLNQILFFDEILLVNLIKSSHNTVEEFFKRIEPTILARAIMSMTNRNARKKLLALISVHNQAERIFNCCDANILNKAIRLSPILLHHLSLYVYPHKAFTSLIKKVDSSILISFFKKYPLLHTFAFYKDGEAFCATVEKLDRKTLTSILIQDRLKALLSAIQHQLPDSFNYLINASIQDELINAINEFFEDRPDELVVLINLFSLCQNAKNLAWFFKTLRTYIFLKTDKPLLELWEENKSNRTLLIGVLEKISTLTDDIDARKAALRYFQPLITRLENHEIGKIFLAKLRVGLTDLKEQSMESKDQKDPKDPKDGKDLKDQKDQKDHKDQKDPKDHKDQKDPKDQKDQKDPKEDSKQKDEKQEPKTSMLISMDEKEDIDEKQESQRSIFISMDEKKDIKEGSITSPIPIHDLKEAEALFKKHRDMRNFNLDLKDSSEEVKKQIHALRNCDDRPEWLNKKERTLLEKFDSGRTAVKVDYSTKYQLMKLVVKQEKQSLRLNQGQKGYWAGDFYKFMHNQRMFVHCRNYSERRAHKKEKLKRHQSDKYSKKTAVTYIPDKKHTEVFGLIHHDTDLQGPVFDWDDVKKKALFCRDAGTFGNEWNRDLEHIDDLVAYANCLHSIAYDEKGLEKRIRDQAAGYNECLISARAKSILGFVSAQSRNPQLTAVRANRKHFYKLTGDWLPIIHYDPEFRTSRLQHNNYQRIRDKIHRFILIFPWEIPMLQKEIKGQKLHEFSPDKRMMYIPEEFYQLYLLCTQAQQGKITPLVFLVSTYSLSYYCLKNSFFQRKIKGFDLGYKPWTHHLAIQFHEEIKRDIEDTTQFAAVTHILEYADLKKSF